MLCVKSTAIYAGLTVEDLEWIDYCYAPAYGAAKDNINIAGYVASNTRRKETLTITPEEFAILYRKDMTLQILDVRSDDEYKLSKIDRSINIYINDLRQHLGTIDKKRPVYVYCAVGFRGYIAAKMLQHLGFQVYNILGGIEALNRVFTIN